VDHHKTVLWNMRAVTVAQSTIAQSTIAQAAPLLFLIEDVKRFGQTHAKLGQRFEDIAQNMTSSVVVLACTELPLIAANVAGKTFIDVTECVAETLAIRERKI
jgi:aspartate racemase